MYGSDLRRKISRKNKILGCWLLALSAIATTACSTNNLPTTARTSADIATAEATELAETPDFSLDVSACRFSPTYAEGGTETVEPEPAILSIFQEEIELSLVPWDGASCLRVTELSYSPDGSQIATGSVDGTVRLWDSRGNQLNTFSPLAASSGRIEQIVYSPDGSQLAIAGGRHSKTALWNLAEDTMIGFAGSLRAGRIEYSLNSQLIAIPSIGGAVGLWDLAGNQIAALEYPGQPISLDVDFHPESDRLITDGRDGTVRLWDTAGSQLAVLRGHQGNFEKITFSPNGSQILTLMGDNVVRLWDADGSSQGTLSNYSQKIERLVYSPDSQRIATGGHRGEAILWNSRGHKLASLSGHSKQVSHVVFSPDGEQIATASPEEGTVRMWNSTGELLSEIEAHADGVTALQYSPNGQMIVTGGRDDAARLWDRSGNLLAAVESTPEDGGFSNFTTLRFSPDSSQLLVVGPLDDAAYLWDINRL